MALNLLPLTLAAIVFSTAIPIELGPPTLPSVTPLPLDFLLNVALYVPLGLALWRRPPRKHSLVAPIVTAFDTIGPWTAVAAGALLSALIETLQIWFVNRQPSMADVLANAMGTALGIALGGILARRQAARGAAHDGRPSTGSRPPMSLPFVFIGRRAGVAAAAAAFMLAILLVWRAHPSDLSNWDPGYELLLGNELTADRPWRGVISALAVVPDALSPDVVSELANAGDAVAGESLDGPGRWLVDAPMALDGTPVRITDGFEDDFVRAIVQRNAFTVVVRGATADTHQEGPARLVSFSRDPYHRNFDLGQEGRRIRFRVRTPAAGLNGDDIYTETADVLEAQRPTTIVTSYDGDIARIYVDGRLEARTNLAAATCLIYTVCDADLPLAAGLLGACLAICGLPVAANSRGGPVMVVLASTTITAALVYVGQAGNTVPEFHHWVTFAALGGASSIAIAARLGR